jgi:hypothetical protein
MIDIVFLHFLNMRPERDEPVGRGAGANGSIDEWPVSFAPEGSS